ncbi:MAG: glycosyltransferase, partial [Armatimonadota bacterium]|nr:glycosyltransferase [Armatimonadota bacterium]
PLVPGRFVYGPVGGGVRVPWRLARYLGLRGIAYEAVRELARLLGRYLNPLARLAWRRADVILAQNPETVRWLPRRHRARAHVFPNALVALDELPPPPGPRTATDRVALFVGRLLPWKGGAIALEVIARAPDWRLAVIGDGPDRRRLERLARRRGVAERVEFRGWQQRDEVWRVMREEASILLFPSLHDEAGWAVVEALSNGLPVLCLDHGGPPVVAHAACGPAGSARTARTVIPSLPELGDRAFLLFGVGRGASSLATSMQPIGTGQHPLSAVVPTHLLRPPQRLSTRTEGEQHASGVGVPGAFGNPSTGSPS